MDYHSDRFLDHSLIFEQKREIVAVLPANHKESAIVSHGGLTYGGIVSDGRMKAALMLEVFDSLRKYLAGASISVLRYKAIPHIYHLVPSEEDLYALFRLGATLVRRDISASIGQASRLPEDKGRVRRLGSEDRVGVEIGRSNDFEEFMQLTERVLSERHGTKPVHTSQEMRLLADRFPENIKLFVIKDKGILRAGAIIYENAQVAHLQYISADDEGRKKHATDVLADFLLQEVYKSKPWFDFGISTEHEGRYLNEGLASFKEKFGARAVMYDTYELAIGE
jgi:hypothetical protein